MADRPRRTSRGTSRARPVRSRDQRSVRRPALSVFGSEPRIRRPVLLLLVYGAFLVLVGVTASAQASMVTSHFTEAATNAVVGGDVASVRVLVAGDLLTGSDLTATGVPDAERQAKLQTVLASLGSTSGILHAELRRADGALVATDRDRGAAGRTAGRDRPDRRRRHRPARRGRRARDDLAAPMLLRERLPINDRQRHGPRRADAVARRRSDPREAGRGPAPGRPRDVERGGGRCRPAVHHLPVRPEAAQPPDDGAGRGHPARSAHGHATTTAPWSACSRDGWRRPRPTASRSRWPSSTSTTSRCSTTTRATAPATTS